MTDFEVILLIFAVLSFIGAVMINYYNNLRDAKNGHINHSKALRIKIVSCLPTIAILASFSNWKWILALGSSAFLVGMLFMLCFEGAWGMKVANDFFYRSTATGKNKSNTDKWVQKWSRGFYISVKITLVLLSMYVYHIGLQK